MDPIEEAIDEHEETWNHWVNRVIEQWHFLRNVVNIGVYFVIDLVRRFLYMDRGPSGSGNEWVQVRSGGSNSERPRRIIAPSSPDEIIEIPDDSPRAQTPPVASPEHTHEIRNLNEGSSQRRQLVDPIMKCKLLALIGGVVMGYTLNVTGVAISIPTFLYRLSPTIYDAIQTADRTDFCIYNHPLILLLSSLIHFIGSASMWLAFKLQANWGRRPTLILGSLSFLLGLSFILWFPHFSALIGGKILIGFGIGFINQVVPMICFELVPDEVRERIDSLFGYQTAGNTLVQGIGFVASFFPVWGWRLPYIILFFLVFALILVSFLIDETPNFLIYKGKLEQAQEILRKYRRDSDIELEVLDILHIRDDDRTKNPIRELLNWENRPILIIKFLETMLPQFIATNSIVFFGPLIFNSLTPTLPQSLLSTLSSIASTTCTLLVSYSINRVGRRCLCLSSSIMVLATQIMMWTLLYLKVKSSHLNLKRNDACIAMTLLILHISSFCALTNTHGWTTASFSSSASAFGSVFFKSFDLLMNGIMNQILLYIICGLGRWSLLYFGSLTCCSIFLIWFFLPETTGIGKYAIRRRVWRIHWFWSRYTQEED